MNPQYLDEVLADIRTLALGDPPDSFSTAANRVADCLHRFATGNDPVDGGELITIAASCASALALALGEDRKDPERRARAEKTLEVCGRVRDLILRDDTNGPLTVEFLAGTLRGGCSAYLEGWQNGKRFTTYDLCTLASLALELAREVELAMGASDVALQFFVIPAPRANEREVS